MIHPPLRGELPAAETIRVKPLLAALLAPIARDDNPDRDVIDRALVAYEELRRRRTQSIARRARMVGRIAQARGPVTSRLRNLAIRALPTRAADRHVTEIQAWQPPLPGGSTVVGGGLGLKTPRRATDSYSEVTAQVRGTP